MRMPSGEPNIDFDKTFAADSRDAYPPLSAPIQVLASPRGDNGDSVGDVSCHYQPTCSASPSGFNILESRNDVDMLVLSAWRLCVPKNTRPLLVSTADISCPSGRAYYPTIRHGQTVAIF